MNVLGVAEVGNSLFVIGGNDGTSFLNSCERYDPLTNKWSYVPPMSRPRAGIGAAVVDGILYVAGDISVSHFSELGIHNMSF